MEGFSLTAHMNDIVLGYCLYLQSSNSFDIPIHHDDAARWPRSLKQKNKKVPEELKELSELYKPKQPKKPNNPD